MSKRPKVPAKPEIDQALRAAFTAVESQPVPEALHEHLHRLSATPRRQDRRS